MTALEYFRIFASRFSAVDDAAVGVWITMAESLAETGCLDTERAAMATALYAAHLMAIEQSSASGSMAVGPITMEREGDLQRQYGAVKGGDTWLGQTPFGQQYLDMTKGCFGAAIMTRVGPA